MPDDKDFLPTNRQDLTRIDSVCDKFEVALREQREPSIEDYLKGVDPDIHKALLAELLSIEVAYRKEVGASIDAEQYMNRFTQHHDVIQSALSSDLATIDGQTTETMAAGVTRTFPSVTVGKRVGDYRILEEIARGGMGIVYKANQLRLDRTVALKMILKGQLATQSEVARFYSEARAIAALEHPAIISIYDVDCEDEHHFFSMNYFEGKTLAQRYGEVLLDETQATQIAEQIATGMAYAHAKGVIHRDLKLENILINSNNEIQIIDFGLCKIHDGKDRKTLTGQLLGTPIYMSPEQARGNFHAVGVSTDIYAMGMILYRLGTLRFPFESDSIYGLLREIEEMEPPPPSSLNPVLSEEFDKICLRCLAKNPDDRYPTAQALVEALRLTHDPIRAGKPVSQSWFTSRSPMSTATGMVCLVLVLGIVASLAVWLGLNHDQGEPLAAGPPTSTVTEHKTDLTTELLIDGTVLTSFSTRIGEENSFVDIDIPDSVPILFVAQLELRCPDYDFYSPPDRPAVPSKEAIAQDPEIIYRDALEQYIRGKFHFAFNLLVKDRNGQSLVDVDRSSDWSTSHNVYISETWDDKSQTVNINLACPIALVNQSHAETIDLSFSILGDQKHDSELQQCQLELRTPKTGEGRPLDGFHRPQPDEEDHTVPQAKNEVIEVLEVERPWWRIW